MPTIPTATLKNWQSSLLGRLKLNFYQGVSNKENFIPDVLDTRHFILSQFRKNYQLGVLFTYLLSLNQFYLNDYSNISEANNIINLLALLEDSPLENPIFIELLSCPDLLSASTGFLIYHENLREGGLVYVITIFDEPSFPNVGRIEMRTSRRAPEPMFLLMGQEGVTQYSLHNYQQSPQIKAALKALTSLCKSKRDKFLTPLQAFNLQISTDEASSPPIDPKLEDLLQACIRDELKCYKLNVPISSIRPFDYDFCLSFPLKTIELLEKDIGNDQQKNILEMLVYWNGTQFIMSDDYPIYLSYRKQSEDLVPVVVIGEYPLEFGQPLEIGNYNLLPPVWIPDRDPILSSEPQIQDKYLVDRLKIRSNSSTIIELYGKYFSLTYILEYLEEERSLHQFLLKNPIVLDPYVQEIMSEVRLGADYRIDLIIQYQFNDKRILLVELERANIPIFTSRGRPTAHVTHAIQQVEDWLRWWVENPEKIPIRLDKSTPPLGLVIMGRDKDMDSLLRRRLLHLNQNRRVQLITYDDLLDRVENLIRNLERNI